MKFVGIVLLINLLRFPSGTFQQVPEGSGGLQPIETALKTFSGNLYNAIERLNTESNVVFSPISVSQILGMLLAGAKENTLIEIIIAMGITDDDITHLTLGSFGQISNSQEILRVGNKLFLSTAFQNLKESYRQKIKFYSSAIESINFADPNVAAEKINEWISENTDGNIQQLLNSNSLSPSTNLVVANTVYFEAKWLTRFTALQTPCEFTTPTGPKNVSCMRQEGNFLVQDTQTMTFVAIPYESELTYFIIGLPKTQTNDLSEFAFEAGNILASMDPPSWSSIKVKLTLPKFNVSTVTDMKQVLKELNIIDLFSPSDSDLTGIFQSSDKNLNVDMFTQMARITVDDKGTKAAAASVASIILRKITEDINVNRPFFYAIYSNPIKMFTFMGHVVDPTMT